LQASPRNPPQRPRRRPQSRPKPTPKAPPTPNAPRQYEASAHPSDGLLPRACWSPQVSLGRPFHNPNLLLTQPIKLIHELINLTVRDFDLPTKLILLM